MRRRRRKGEVQWVWQHKAQCAKETIKEGHDVSKMTPRRALLAPTPTVPAPLAM